MSVTSESWTSTIPGAKGRSLTLLPLPVMQALKEGDLDSAQELFPLKLPSILISDLCRSTWKRRYAEIELNANDELGLLDWLLIRIHKQSLGERGSLVHLMRLALLKLAMLLTLCIAERATQEQRWRYCLRLPDAIQMSRLFEPPFDLTTYHQGHWSISMDFRRLVKSGMKSMVYLQSLSLIFLKWLIRCSKVKG